MLNKFIIGLGILLLLLITFNYIGNSNQKAYNDCVNAGVQSNDTCKFYTMN